MRPSLILAALLAPACYAQQTVGSVEARGAVVRGPVRLNGDAAELRSGAELVTANESASIDLVRGGVLKVCPQSSVQLTSSPDGKQLLVALNRGAIETNYTLGGGSDVVLTPDFQFQLPGPGNFRYAIGAGERVCAKALPGSDASVIANENLGTGTFQLRPGTQARFLNGAVANAETQDVIACGCAESAVKGSQPELGFPEEQSATAAKALASGQSPPVAPPISGVPETAADHQQSSTQVSVPLAFEGAPPSSSSYEQPADTYKDAPLAAIPETAQPKVEPPAKPQKRNWFQRFGSAIGRLFGKK